MRKGKKIINNPKNIVSEVLDGFVFAYDGEVTRVKGKNVILRNILPEGKVTLLVGGGSGHEPLFAGFIGKNLADGAVAGNIFAAPSPDQILAATQALDKGKGVLYLYGNYSGDNLNFDMAAELAADAGIRTRTVRVWDDVASAPPERMEDRRGIAGDFMVIKVAGGAAASLDSLDEVYRVAVKARDHTRSMGVAVAAGTFPETGEPTFELPDDEIEIGLGLHGEAGVSRTKMMPADQVVDFILQRILADLPFKRGDRVCLLVNNLGATTMTELLIINRRVHQVLSEEGIAIYDTVIGSFCTSQEMAGFSITLMRLDDELARFYDLPVSALAYSKEAKE
ncbi:MAG: dihydroxyacetone kinase subunit DhaK [Chloroflexi bacterium]|nr:MAG: dihydroxyacetone kinase subunit DhaK [Chloroflexota bacterium]